MKKWLAGLFIPGCARRICLTLGGEFSPGNYIHHDGNLTILYRKELTNYNAEVLEPEIIEICVSKDPRKDKGTVYYRAGKWVKIFDYRAGWVKQVRQIARGLK